MLPTAASTPLLLILAAIWPGAGGAARGWEAGPSTPRSNGLVASLHASARGGIHDWTPPALPRLRLPSLRAQDSELDAQESQGRHRCGCTPGGAGCSQTRAPCEHAATCFSTVGSIPLVDEHARRGGARGAWSSIHNQPAPPGILQRDRHAAPGEHSMGGRVAALRGGFRNLLGESLGEVQCRNFSRGDADLPRAARDSFRMGFNETIAARERRILDQQDAEEQAELQEQMDRARHVLPDDWETNDRWDKDLRACCLCGLLKNERMWLEFGCENCPFLIDPGSNDKERVDACTTVLHSGMMLITDGEGIKESKVIKEKFPRGVLGTADLLPTSGLYCLGFFRALPPEVVTELKERGIDHEPRLWNRGSAEHLSQEAQLEKYQQDMGTGDSTETDDDEDLSGFIDDTPRDEYGNLIPEGKDKEEKITPMDDDDDGEYVGNVGGGEVSESQEESEGSVRGGASGSDDTSN